MKTEKKSIFLKLLLIAGCGIFFYPTISDAVNGLTETTGIVAYNEALTGFESVQIDKIREGARAYNEKVRECENGIANAGKIKGYEKALNPFSTGMMGSLYIPKIEVNLPIYHDVNEGIIQNGVGHLPGTSLPIGGSSTHCVLSTHSGLPKAKLFTDLHKLDEGDEFILSVLGENLYYRVVMIKIVLPTQTSDLKVVDGKDYVTLTTCTPYGINTHRLLVRGERVSAPAGGKRQPDAECADAGSDLRTDPPDCNQHSERSVPAAKRGKKAGETFAGAIGEKKGEENKICCTGFGACHTGLGAFHTDSGDCHTDAGACRTDGREGNRQENATDGGEGPQRREQDRQRPYCTGASTGKGAAATPQVAE